MTSPNGSVVRISYDANEGDAVAIGHFLVTGTGRYYRVIGARRQARGLHVGRYHLVCIVEPPAVDATLHPLVWNPR